MDPHGFGHILVYIYIYISSQAWFTIGNKIHYIIHGEKLCYIFGKSQTLLYDMITLKLFYSSNQMVLIVISYLATNLYKFYR